MRTPGTREVAVMAALTVAAVALMLGFLTIRPGTIQAVPAGPPPTADNPCPNVLRAAQDGFNTFLTPVDGDLPENPERIWLCGEPYDTGTAGPLEPLTTNVNEAVAAFNALEPGSTDMMCTQEYRMTYLTVLDYPDGRLVLRGELHGCRVITDGRNSWLGGEEWLNTLIGLWETQRSQQSAPSETPPICPPMTTIIAAKPAEVSTGHICTGPFDEQRVTGELDAELVDRIVANLDTGRSADDPRHQDLQSTTFVLSDPWGSTLSIIPLAEHGFFVGWADPMGSSGEKLYWTPPADLERELRALL